MTPSEIRGFLARHGLVAHKGRGQNFLADERLAHKLVREARVGPEDTVLEIGPGLGILTRALAARAGRVVALEVDSGIVRALGAEGGLPPNVRLVHGDALDADLAALLGPGPGPRRVVANLPYAISGPLLRRILDLGPELAGWAVLVQREVAERLCAAPGGRTFGSLTVLHALVARVEPVLDLHPRCFHPVPRVVSRFVRLTPRTDAPAPELLRQVERWVRAGFAQRRKTLRNALRAAAGPGCEDRVDAALDAAGIAPGARAEEVAPERWRALAEAGGAALGAD